jgi:3',5'-cyclic-nucleotide phosphodiesterase
MEKRLHEELERERRRVDEMELTVMDANQPRVLHRDRKEALWEVATCRYVDADGTARPFLESDEIRRLAMPTGSLDPEERAHVESHVSHTIAFLRRIPWTDDLRGVPEIAGAHHEKLDGSGYPFGLRGESISLAARILTLADMFDALVAGDRPYKPGLPPERALQVLEAEARAGKLDAGLFALLVESAVWRAITPGATRRA